MDTETRIQLSHERDMRQLNRAARRRKRFRAWLVGLALLTVLGVSVGRLVAWSGQW